MHPTKGHNRIGEDVIRTFLRAYINLRLGLDFKPGQKLNPIDLKKGWLGDPKTYAVASYGNYAGDKKAAMWLPDETTALAWKNFLTHP